MMSCEYATTLLNHERLCEGRTVSFLYPKEHCSYEFTSWDKISV